MKSPAGTWLFDASVNLGRFGLQHPRELGDDFQPRIARAFSSLLTTNRGALCYTRRQIECVGVGASGYMAVGLGGASPRTLASVCAGGALVALGSARARMAALAVVLLAGLAMIPPAQGADAPLPFPRYKSPKRPFERRRLYALAIWRKTHRRARRASSGSRRSTNPARSCTLGSSTSARLSLAYAL